MTARTVPGVLALSGALLALQPAAARAGPGPAPAGELYRLWHGQDTLWLHAPDGVPLLDLRPELWLALEPVRARPLARHVPLRLERAALSRPSLERTRGGFVIRTEAGSSGARYQIALHHRVGIPELVIEVQVRYGTERSVRAELLRFALGPGGAARASVLDRGYRLEQRLPPVLSDALGPRVARLGPIALVATEGVQTIWLRAARANADGGRGAVLELELDHEGNHPFRPHLRCVTDPRARVARGDLSPTFRPAGSLASARARLLLGEPRLLLPGRYPRGQRAALVFTDHADQSNLAKLEAVAHGETGALEGARHGLCGRGLGFTKTVFAGPARGYDPQLEDPGYRALLERIGREGVEIGLHSATGASDLPARTEAALARFRAAGFRGRTWIDHQPTTNCEAVTAEGWDPRSPYHTLSLLAASGFSLFWSAEDVAPPPGSLNLLAPEPRSQRRPAIYRFAATSAAAAAELRLFASTRFFLPRASLERRLSARSLTELAQERGLCLAHTYLDTWRARGKLAPRSLLEPLAASPGREAEPARFRLRPSIDRLFAALAARQSAGELWVAALERVVSHLEAALAVELAPTASGTLRVRSARGRALPGLTLIALRGALPPGSVLLVDGRPPAGVRDRGGEQEIWFDLPARGAPEISIRERSGRSLRFSAPARIALELAPERSPR